MALPKDPAILLSFVNTKLRDCYKSLDDMCDDMEESSEEICAKLKTIGYSYSKEKNAFI